LLVLAGFGHKRGVGLFSEASAHGLLARDDRALDELSMPARSIGLRPVLAISDVLANRPAAQKRELFGNA